MTGRSPTYANNGRGTDRVFATSGGQVGELLNLCDEFFRAASPRVHAELRHFLTAHGHHPQAGLNTFIDLLSFTAQAAQRESMRISGTNSGRP